jgi:LysR family hydrogen peroxide-inducible transcriptional activator
MSISLKQMRYAVAVAESGRFGRAAGACNISQPALSQQIQQLEESCGAALFDRLKTGARLTPFGVEFVARARQVLEEADALAQFATAHKGRPDRPIRFGLIPTVAPYLLPGLFPALTQTLTGEKFTISENRTEALIAGLVDGSLDVALIGTEAPVTGPRLVSVPLFEDPFVLATPSEQTPAQPVELSALAPERILLLDEGHCFRDQTIAACRLDGNNNATRTFAATSLSTIVEFVANGQGVTLLPSIALRKEAADKRIAIHHLHSPGASRLLSLVWREATLFGPTFERIADVIRQSGPDTMMAK